jgi:hypothetical protein
MIDPTWAAARAAATRASRVAVFTDMISADRATVLRAAWDSVIR